MATLAAVLLANADGQTARTISTLLAARRDGGRMLALYFAAFAVLAAVSATGAMLAARSLGVGVLSLMAAMALASAAAALVIPRRSDMEFKAATDGSPTRMFVRFLLYQLGDRNQFLIFGLGALSGAALWGIAGGAAGLLVAMLPVAAFGPALLDGKRARHLRWLAAAVLMIWALVYLRRAFGV